MRRLALPIFAKPGKTLSAKGEHNQLFGNFGWAYQL